MSNERKIAKAQSRIGSRVWTDIIQLLQQDWSPEQISLWLKTERDVSISHEWIYQFVLKDKLLGDHLYRHLRCQKRRRKRYGSYSRRGQLVESVLYN